MIKTLLNSQKEKLVSNSFFRLKIIYRYRMEDPLKISNIESLISLDKFNTKITITYPKNDCKLINLFNR